MGGRQLWACFTLVAIGAGLVLWFARERGAKEFVEAGVVAAPEAGRRGEGGMSAQAPAPDVGASVEREQAETATVVTAPGEPIVVSAGWRVQGVVRDEFGQPAQGVDVTLIWLDFELSAGNGDRRLTTQADGGFEFLNLARGMYWLSVSGQEYFAGSGQDIDLTSGDRTGIEPRITRGMVFCGEVVWPDGSPVSSGCVEFDGWRGSVENGSLRVRTVQTKPGLLCIDATRPGAVGRLQTTVLPGGGYTRWVLEEIQTAEVHLEIVGPRGGRLEANVYVHYRGTCHVEPARMTRGKEVGTFCAELPPGRVLIEVSPTSHHQDTLSLTITGPEVVRIELEEAVTLRGKVLDTSGRPCGGATVWSLDSRQSVEAADDGSFEMLSGASPERIVAGKSGFGSSLALEVDLDAGRANEALVLQLREACEIAGEVHGVIDSLTHVILDVHGLDTYGELAADGSFRFVDVAPGAYEAFVRRERTLGPRVPVRAVPGSVAHVQLQAP